MKKVNNRIIIPVSLFLIAAMIGIVVMDLLYKFGNYDTPFMLEFVLYLLYTFLRRSTSKLTFIVVILFIVSMGISYITAGSTRLTERFGEWFYLYFIFGLIQYGREFWLTKNI